MHLAPPFVRSLLVMLLVLTISAMLGALVWVAPLLQSRRPWLPPARLRPSRWGLLTVLAVLLTYRLLAVGISTEVMSRAGPAPAGAVPSFTSLMLAVTLVNAAALVVLPMVVRLLSRSSLADMGLTLDRFGANVKTGALAFLVVTPWVYLIFGLAQLVSRGHRHPLEEMVRREPSFAGIALAGVSAVILAPLAEELIFRGVLQGWLDRVLLETKNSSAVELAELELLPHEAPPPSLDDAQTRSKGRPLWPSVVISAAIFAAMHAPEMPAPIALFPLALVLGSLYQRTGSLVASVTLHALFNAFSTLMLLIAVA